MRLLLVYLGLVALNIGQGGYAPLLKRFAQEHEVNPFVFCFYRGLEAVWLSFSKRMHHMVF